MHEINKQIERLQMEVEQHRHELSRYQTAGDPWGILSHGGQLLAKVQKLKACQLYRGAGQLDPVKFR